MADVADLKSADGFPSYGFESRLRHNWGQKEIETMKKVVHA